METKLFYTSHDGKTLDLFHNDYFDLINADGLTVANANITTTTTPMIDGDETQNVRANPRPLTLDLQIKSGLDVERAKRYILNVIKIKKRGTFTFIQGAGTEKRTIEISGIVQNISMPRFTNAVVMQISIYCNNSFWQDVDDVITDINRAIANHHFEIAITAESPVVLGIVQRQVEQTYINDGDADAGMIITINAVGTVTNPKIINQNGEFIGVNCTMSAGDKIVINTNKGNKSITKNGVSIFNKLMSGSTFLNMEIGDNVFESTADSGAQFIYYYVNFKRRFV